VAIVYRKKREVFIVAEIFRGEVRVFHGFSPSLHFCGRTEKGNEFDDEFSSIEQIGSK
jgi:hypothetical protein